MPVLNRIADFHEEITAWRRDIHNNPELGYDEHRTAGKVAGLLKEFGVDEVHEGIGQTGVVGIIKGRSNTSSKSIALRADMDALPILEDTGKDYASTNEGKMHACGHDGHTAMLLGAAKYLSESRDFDGQVVLIFQPAEEGGGGAKAMIDDGLFDRFQVDEIYGMHNLPGMEPGDFGIREGGLMASSDTIKISIEGKGGHAALPHQAIDPIVIGSQIIAAVQSVISRNLDPLTAGVVSITQFHAGSAENIIPQTAELGGTVRALSEEVRQTIYKRLHTIVEQTASLYGGKATLEYTFGYPVTLNHGDQTVLASEIAAEVSGDERVDTNLDPMMGAEDFSFYLEERPGAFIFTGNGNSAALHHPKYDFNDDIIPTGVSYWVKLVNKLMPA